MARWIGSAALVAIACLACSPDLREEPDLAGQFDTPGTQRPVSEPVRYVERRAGRSYGLPREGQPGLADLIALLPAEAVQAGDSDIWSGPDDQPPCASPPWPGRPVH